MIQGPGLADEDCAPLSGLYPPPKKDDANGSDWLTYYYKATNPLIYEKMTCEQREIFNQVMMGGGNPATIAFIQELMRHLLAEVNGNHVRRQNCERKAFPPGRLRATTRFQLLRENKKITKLTADLLNNGKAVTIGLFTKMGTSPPTTHAIVATNVRRKCCANECWNQYQVHDDTGLAWAQGKHEDGWVNESYLFSLVPVDLNAGTISWIEPGASPK